MAIVVATATRLRLEAARIVRSRTPHPRRRGRPRTSASDGMGIRRFPWDSRLSPFTGSRVPMQTLHVNGYDMAYVEVGKGPPLVCVHGTLGDFRTWSAVFGPLSEKPR